MKILHIFYSTLPSATGGDIRNRDVVESQVEVGIDVVVVSSPFQAPAEVGAKVEHFSGIPYHRSFELGGGLRISERNQGMVVKLRKALKLISFGDFITVLARREKPDVIHAHSTFFCALAGWWAARRLGRPLVYEVRSLWEERSVMQQPSLKTRLISRLIRAIETRAMSMADHVVAISEGLCREVQLRGIPAERITLVGNGVNLSRVQVDMPSVVAKPPADWVFAYIGNLSDIEGLDLMIEAVRSLRVQGWTNPVHFYGGGPAEAALKQLAADVAGITFHGRFNPADAPAIYASVDVVVNPRRWSPLTDKVTPLKPLEAMAWRKPVITSSVGGMLELVRHGETGVVFEADEVPALAAALTSVTDSPEILPALTERARQFVMDQRSWNANGLTYKALYARLAGERA